MSVLQYIFSLILLLVYFPVLAQQAVLDTATAQRIDSTEEFILDGVIEPVNQATVSAEVSGRVEAILFDVDDMVKQGEIIVRIRDNEYRSGLAQARAALSEAKTLLENAEREFTRIKDLHDKKVVSRAQYDQATATLESSRARVNSAEASVNQAKLQLDNTVIRAPYSGIVVARHVELGELTNVGQPVMSGYGLGKLRVRVNIPQSIIAQVREHAKARIILLDGSDSIDAEDLVIFPVADSDSHAFRVRIDLPGENRQLFPGMLVKAAFVINRKQRLMVPIESLVRRSEVTGVYVVDDTKKVHFRQVRTGATIGEQVEIVAGLESGEQVALDPVQAGIQLKTSWEGQ